MSTASATTATARDRQDVGWAGFVVWLVAVLVLIGEGIMVFTIVTGLVIGNALAGDVTAHAAIDALPQVTTFLIDGDSGDLTDVDLRVRLLCASPVIVDLVTILLAARLLTRIIARIKNGDSFAPEVPRAWRRLSAVLFVGGVVEGALNMVALSVIGSDPKGVLAPGQLAEEISVIRFDGSGWPWMLLLLGVVAGALGVAFQQGARLQEDVDGVI